MKRFRKTIALLLVLCFCVSAMCGCGKETVKEGRKREKSTTTVTPTTEPTLTPTDAPTGTPVVTATPTPNAKPWSTPNFGKVTYNDAQKEFDDLLNKLLVELADGEGMSLHFYYEDPQKYGIRKDNNFGTGEDAEQNAKDFTELCKKYSEILKGIDYNALTDGQKVNYDRLVHEFNAGMKYQNLNVKTYCGIFSINNCTISSLSTLLSEYSLLNEQDVKDLLEVLDTMPAYLEESIAQAKKSYIDDGCLLTEAMINNVVEKAKELTVTENNPLIDSFAQNIDEAGLSEAAKNAYIEEYKKKLNDKVFPALKDYAKQAEAMRSSCSKELFGMSSLSGGKEYFEFLAQETVGTTMSGTEMLAYMQKKFDTEYNELVDLIMNNYAVLNQYPYPNYKVTDPKAMLDSLKEYITSSYPKIPDTTYTVSALPKALQIPGVLAYFLTPQIDNPQRKVIRYNPSSVSSDDSASFFGTLAHEGYPGHLYQDEFFANCEGHHPINMILSYTGYMEGWAVMAGQEAYYFILPGDVAKIYALDYNLGMDMASIAAIGVHYAGWSVDDLEDFLDPYNYGSFAEGFYEEILADPVVYLPYTLGRYLMLDTMDKLKAKGYSDMEAKTAILNIGPCSFDVLWKELGIE